MILWGDAPRVVIVDDSEENVRFLRRLLTAAGYACVSIDNGADAFDGCVSAAADVVLLDIQLPEVDGLTVCRQLKSAPETRLTPVLIMTGAPDGRHYLAALEAGADDFLAKPIARAELLARIRSAVRLKRYVDELDNAAASIVMLGATIEARDRYTKGHCQRLADSASQLGKRIGLAVEDLRALERGGYLHDLGKIAIPDAVLFKPGPLTPAERELITTHPVVGDRICAPLRTLDRVRPIIRHHHETLDGKGYPEGLRGASVPLLAQITGIADVYDALTTDRPYRGALEPAVAFGVIRDEALAGKRDPALVDEFIAMLGSTTRDSHFVAADKVDLATSTGPHPTVVPDPHLNAITDPHLRATADPHLINKISHNCAERSARPQTNDLEIGVPSSITREVDPIGNGDTRSRVTAAN